MTGGVRYNAPMDENLRDDDELLPEEQEALKKRQAAAALEKLEAFGAVIAKKREEAITGRASSGIEVEWGEDQESYEGIDDANRDTAQTKPTNVNGSSIGVKPRQVRSTVFLNITRPYVDAAAAKVADMLLPTDDRNYGLSPTPIPELDRAKTDQTPMVDANSKPIMQIVPGPNGQQVGKPFTMADRAKLILEKAAEAARNAETQVDDWLVECQYHAEVRIAIEDCARIGTGILKGPYPVVRRKKRISRANGQTTIEIVEEIVPRTKRVDPWNFYPDPSCGENIHDGAYCFEKDSLTAKQLRDLIGGPGYIESQILEVLEEGPGRKYSGTNERVQDKERFEVWYFYGSIDAEDMRTAGCDCEDGDQIPAVLVLVNDRVIKAAINPLDSGEFPYDVMPWQRRADMWAGVGVSRQVRTPQRMLNASTRNMMDNAGLSAGPQLVIRRGVIEPADGNWQITPRKTWFASAEAEMKSVADAFVAINIPTMQADLMAIVQFAMKMAEDVTGLPMLLQGQQGQAPETVGGMQLLSTNASAVLRRIARTFDDRFTEPHIRRYYEWLMLYSDNEEAKGDFSIDARGSTALVERDIQNQWIVQMLVFGQNPANPFKIDPAKLFEEAARSQKFDPSRIQYTEDEWAKVQEALAKSQPQDPAIVVAQIRAQAEVERAKAQAAADESEVRMRQQIAEQNHAAQLTKLQMEREIAILKLASEQKISIEKIKAQLTDTAIKEKNKRELYNAEQQLKVTQGSGI